MSEKPHPTSVLVKGYMRPDKTSYVVVIPKEVRQEFKLSGGEHFIMVSKPKEKKIILKHVEINYSED
ncbi:hypothetical protein KY366_00865 [Candidatus Woesearchaeota archaeon]|nr:hypothetical protein [Candidatus Woesearchaeota archaeon]